MTSASNILDHDALVVIEYRSFRRSPDWELNNIKTALNLLPFLNGPQEKARLEAVEQILAERRRKD